MENTEMVTVQKRKRSNYNRTKSFLSKIRDLAYFAKACHYDCDKLIQEKAKLSKEYSAVSTAWECGYLHGYAESVWDDIWRNCVEWRLGFEDIATAIPSKEWDYAYSVPTHGGHFWKDTNINFSEWKKF